MSDQPERKGSLPFIFFNWKATKDIFLKFLKFMVSLGNRRKNSTWNIFLTLKGENAMKKLIAISITIILTTFLSYSNAFAEGRRHKNAEKTMTGYDSRNHLYTYNKHDDSRNHKNAYNKNHNNGKNRYNIRDKRHYRKDYRNRNNKHYDRWNHRYAHNKRYQHKKHNRNRHDISMNS